MLLQDVSWQEFEKGKLQINVLINGSYVKFDHSPNFPEMPLIEVIQNYVEQTKTVGRNKTLKAFRTWVREQVESTTR